MRIITPHILILLGAIFALGFALFSQYVQGFHPCEMCIWQRWVYGAVILFCILKLATCNKCSQASRLFSILVSLTILAQVTLAVFHAGVELKYWEGFTTCSSGITSGQSIEDLRARIMGAPLVRCDEATWFLFGLSMAAWNAIFAAGLFVVSLIPNCKWPCRKSI